MSFPKNHSRREFLKQLAFVGAGAAAFPSTLAALSDENPAKESSVPGSEEKPAFEMRSRVPGVKSVLNLKTEPVETVRVGIIGLGHRGLGSFSRSRSVPGGNGVYRGLLGEILKIPFARVSAICDTSYERTKEAAEICRRWRPDVPAPKIFSGTESAWETLCEEENIDVIFIATPWRWHAPMAIRAMESGKHAFVEVPAALTLEECCSLVDTSEQTRRHCVMLENCCFGDEEMFVLNMVRSGVFGKLTHAECAYIHDLRAMLYREGSEGDWRREYHKTLNGNLYPTHGLGPVCRYFGVNRGDALDFLVSMSAPEAGLSSFRDNETRRGGNAMRERFSNEKYVCGDVNSTLIKTARGRTILLQHDVVSPRPYSRINLLTGTEATFAGFPPRLALDFPEKYDLEPSCNDEDGGNARGWLDERNFSKMRHLFRPEACPLPGKGGRGGMDYVMCFRLLDCIRRGITPELTVYDAAAWSSIVELSAQSVSLGSAPVRIPDFTRGDWCAFPAV